MKGKKLLFPFISFLESGHFNELRRIQIKRILSRLGLRSEALRENNPNAFCPFSPESGRRAGPDSVNRKSYNIGPVIQQEDTLGFRSHGLRSSRFQAAWPARLLAGGQAANVMPRRVSYRCNHRDCTPPRCGLGRRFHAPGRPPALGLRTPGRWRNPATDAPGDAPAPVPLHARAPLARVGRTAGWLEESLGPSGL